MGSQNTLKEAFIPELGNPYCGKVREIYEHRTSLTMIASDRISIFDRILQEPIRDKGRVLTGISRFWFEKTKDIIPNHMITQPDPNVMVVKKCKPLMLEVIVRGYLVGSLWRDYKEGKRDKCGNTIPDGLNQNDPLPKVIITPTTKCSDGHDEDITKDELIKQGIVTKEQWKKIEKVSLELYQRGQSVIEDKGLILVDTKYEFGLDAKGDILLIDEVHTPDSSRYWFKKDVEMKEFSFPDKEYAREWAMSQGFKGDGKIPTIPIDVQEKIRSGYKEVYETITGIPFTEDSQPVGHRLIKHLKRAEMIKGVFALILVGSKKDQAHVDKIELVLKEKGIPYNTVVASAHKSPEKVLELIKQHNESIEPMVCITVAGMSNALSGMVAANLKWPVIACPPFKDHADYHTNIHSSLQMPSNVPVLTVIDPKNCALAVAKILNTMECQS